MVALNPADSGEASTDSPGSGVAARAPAERIAVSALLALAVAGIVARLVVIWASNGSNDMPTWTAFAQQLRDSGLWETYRSNSEFNHPPLMGLMARGLYALASALDVPFRVLFKLPSLLSDLGVMALLWTWFRPRGQLWAAAAVALFSCNPVSIAITSFHGNTDSLCAGLMLAAAILHQRGRAFLAGLVLAAAVNVKLIPLILLPGLLILCSSWRAALRLGLGFALGVLPIAAACIVVPEAFYQNAVRYGSHLNRWGLITWGFEARSDYPALAKLILVDYRHIGRFVVLGVVTLFALLGRAARFGAVRFGAIGFAVFLTLTPGFGIQYMVWIVPLLAAASMRYSAWYALLGGAYTVLVYYSYLVPGEWPLRSFHSPQINHTNGLIGAHAWALLAIFLSQQLLAALREGPHGAAIAGAQRALAARLGLEPAAQGTVARSRS